MNDCTVQSARKLDDYPCRSAGLVEYAYFAKAMDKRIETRCIVDVRRTIIRRTIIRRTIIRRTIIQKTGIVRGVF
ncbi:MAG: DUF6125 family protein, partial [Desulfobacula sp.]|nr:DUF6125 family protein [Desulfobacula sp.]